MNKFMLYSVLCANLIYLVSPTLESVHLIFRHGERCPDQHFMHPTDPYRNKTFAPYGQGQITNVGKQQAYDLGLDIRKRYQSFIRDNYNYKEVDAWSTSFPRGQITLMLVLAGIFKPKDHEIWNKELLWQPVPFKYIPNPDDDDIFLPVLLSKHYIDEYKKSFNKNGKHIMERHRDTIDHIKRFIGVNITDSRHAFTLYMTTSTETCVGYTLPAWFKTISNDMEKFAVSDYQMQISTRMLQRLAMGKLLKKIVKDTHAKIKNVTKHKLHIYSAHDFNIAHLLVVLGEVEVTAVIPYAACVALEVHKQKENVYNVYVVYKNGSYGDWETIKIIPFNMLENLVEDFFETQAFAMGNRIYAQFRYLFLMTMFAFLLYN